MSNKLLITTLVASVVAFILGYLVYGLALASYFEGQATAQVMRADADMVWWAMIVGHLTWGFILTYIIGKLGGISTVSSGAQAGAIIGFFISITFGMIEFGTANLSTITSYLVNAVAAGVTTAITGAVIGWMMGRGKE